MENKRLIGIMLKDMRELEELISEIKTDGKFSLPEVEFLHTRSKGILQLMQMLQTTEYGTTPSPEIREETAEEEAPATGCTGDYEQTAKEEENIPSGEMNADEHRRLGDSFTKGRLLNDIMEDGNKLEYKLSNRPVSSIRAAVGINDRFQYIRELFEGSSEKYADTVAALDSMTVVNDALTYIQQNFQWKDNETSLKFINLIKRRFANE